VNAGKSIKHDVTIILGDMNVKLGKDKLFSRVDGSLS